MGENEDLAHTFTVTAQYVRREQILIDLPSGVIIADHPVALGGDGRGPSAAELVLLALTSCAVLSPIDHASGDSASGMKLTSRATFQSARQRIDGPMVSLGRMAHVHHRLDAITNASISESAALVEAASECAVVVALRDGIAVNDSIEFELDDTPREDLPFINETRRDRENGYRSTLEVGETLVTKAESNWRVAAESIQPNSAILSLATQHYLASSPELAPPLGPRPNEYLAAALAACTVFFIVHQCGFHDIPVGSVRCELTASVDEAGVLRSIDSKAMVQSNLTAEEIESIEFVASHCYIGETFRAGVPVTFEYGVTQSSSPIGDTLGSGMTQNLTCDDGSCCIPDLALKSEMIQSHR
jgi:uncharacterized OsmC-like protein